MTHIQFPLCSGFRGQTVRLSRNPDFFSLKSGKAVESKRGAFYNNTIQGISTPGNSGRKGGVSCTTGELCAALFGDKAGGKAVHSYFRNLASNLFYSLKVLGVGDALVKSRNSYAVNPSRMDCDYYRYIGGDPAAVNSYGGEYMSQYSWAEMTLGWLERRQH